MPEFDRDLQTVKEDVRARSDIVEIVSQYTRLKQTGKTWSGLCPFHSEKRPSFRVTPATQTYRCWSCGEKGDVFTFVEKKENLDFIEALEMLARRAGIRFERGAKNREQVGEREQMFAINALAARYFQERLGHSADAQAYLANRAILKPTQEQWDLGFAPNEWQGLSYYLERQRVDLGIAVKLGLLRTREPGGGTFDTFRNRLMFPIHDVQGRIIAFGGRAMADDPAKYLNSDQSLIFDKSRTLYGLVFARKALSPKKPAVFVEGYVDVITAHQAGFTQCVATLGTSMTEEHARLLARFSPRVIICYDADTAGSSAARRGARVWESIGVEGAEVRVARLREGEDPDSLVRSGQTAEFQRALDEAVPLVQFEIELALKRVDTNSDEGRSQALAEIIPILASVSSLTQRDKYVEKVAHLHPAHGSIGRRAFDALLADIEQYSRQSRGSKSARDRGFPLTEQANRGPLANEPEPPTYRPSSAGAWGRWEPGTRSVKRAGDEGRSPEAAGGPLRPGGESRGTARTGRGPLRDPGPPLLEAPALTGVEKAERQLLRALFTADWRSYVLGRALPEMFVTSHAREMFGLAARMPASEDGTIDAAQVLRAAEAAEDRAIPASEATEPQHNAGFEDDSRAAASDDSESTLFDRAAAGQSAETDDAERDGASDDARSMQSVGAAPAELRQHAGNFHKVGRMAAKTSDFIREVLEDSLSVMSNEPLSEAALGDCIRRLQKHREEQTRRELMIQLGRADLTPQQREALVQQYHEKMRQSRGSPPVAEDDSD